MAHYRAARYDQAVRAYEEGLALDETHKDLHFQMGVVFEKQGRFDQSVAEFRRVIALDPKHAEAYNYVGYMLAEKGVRLDEAERLIQKALELEPENGYYIDSLGWAYYQQGRYAEAVRELRRAVELTRGKEDAVIYDHLGEAYLKTGDDPGGALRLGEVARARPGQRRGPPEDPEDPPGARRPEVRCRRRAGRGARRAAAALALPLAPRRRAPRPRPAPPAAAPITPGQAVELAQRWAAEWAGFPGMRGAIDLTAKNRRGSERVSALLLASPRPRSASRSRRRSGCPRWWRRRGPTTSPSSACWSAGLRPPGPRPEAVERWLGVPLPPATLLRLLVGQRPRRRPTPSAVDVADTPSPHLAWTEDGIRHRVWVTGEGRPVRLLLEAPRGRRPPRRRLRVEQSGRPRRRPPRGPGARGRAHRALSLRRVQREPTRRVPPDAAVGHPGPAASIDRNSASC